ncbi:MAG: hypothetical protein GEU92_04200 [Alphaproteobacteria bacterium]|nr:hypothetical protein [Alphaproteobacteria bacterium]
MKGPRFSMLSTIGSGLRRFRYYRVIGRIHRLRRLVVLLHGVGERWRRGFRAAERGRGFPDELVTGWIGQLRSRSFCVGPALPGETTEALRDYARKQPCYRPGIKERFLISEVRNGHTPRGAPVAVADVVNPPGCPQVSEIVRNPLLAEMAQRYLGYRPRRSVARLFWSPVSRLSDDTRRAAGQTLDFHYDIDACNSFYVYFYLEGGGPSSGAHVVVEGSHGPKPLRMVAGSCFQTEEAVLKAYGADKVTVVAGHPGFCFFEDPACFHKVLAPTEAPRLLMQIRYS